VYHHGGRHEEARRFYAAGFWWAALLRLAIVAVGVALAGPLCRFLNAPSDHMADCILGVALIFIAVLISDTAIMLEIPVYATGRMAGLTAAWGLMGWVRLVITMVALKVFNPSLTVYGGALIGSEFVSFVTLAIFAQRAGVVGAAIPRPEFGSREVRSELFRYGGLAILQQLAALLYVSTDNLLIGRFYGAAAVTHYSMGTRWYPLIQGFLIAAIASLTPLFTSFEARGESTRSRMALLRVVDIICVLAVPACLVPCIVGDIFLVHWVGPEYRGSAAYLIAMLAPLTLVAALEPGWMALRARGQIGSLAVGELVVAVGNVVVSLILALGFKLGLLGFALGNTVALLAKSVILFQVMRRSGDASLPSPWGLLRALPRAIAGGAPALVLLALARPLYAGGMAQVIAAGAVGGALCLLGAALATMGPSGIRALVQIAARAGSRTAS
jgi:Na+-driven multidrug efflux pump